MSETSESANHEFPDLMAPIPDDLEKVLATPHVHEHPIHNRPIWIIWKTEFGRTGVPYFPQLDTVCDDIDSARYHVRMILSENLLKYLQIPETQITVERIPANHRFGSSISHLQMKSHMAIWEERIKRAGHNIQQQLSAGAGDLRQTIDAQLVTWNGVAGIYELIREGREGKARYWLRNPSGEEQPISNDMAVMLRQKWALGQSVDLGYAKYGETTR